MYGRFIEGQMRPRSHKEKERHPLAGGGPGTGGGCGLGFRTSAAAHGLLAIAWPKRLAGRPSAVSLPIPERRGYLPWSVVWRARG